MTDEEKRNEDNEKTIMQKWAETSEEYSKALKKLLEDFGFTRESDVKYEVRTIFPPKFLERFERISRHSTWVISPSASYSAVRLAKAILVASAYLETDDIREIIKWSNL